MTDTDRIRAAAEKIYYWVHRQQVTHKRAFDQLPQEQANDYIELAHDISRHLEGEQGEIDPETLERIEEVVHRIFNYKTNKEEAKTFIASLLTEKEARIAELERRLRVPFGALPCAQCGGPHDFDTSVPSVVWNGIIRAKGLPEYLCTTCIVREFIKAGEGFTAELWGDEFKGVPIEVIVNGQNAKDASMVQEENNSYRNTISEMMSAAKAKRDEYARLNGCLSGQHEFPAKIIAADEIITELEAARDKEK